MSESTNLSAYLALAIAAYMIAAGSSGLTSPTRWSQTMTDFQNHPGLVFIAAIVTFVIGVTLVLLAPDPSSGLGLAVLLVGWVAIAE